MPFSKLTLMAGVVATLAFAAPATAHATGVCDATPTSPDACIAAIQANGAVINDIFKDANGLTAQQLPVYGQFFNAWPGCDITSFAGCGGQDTLPYDCPGQYTCPGTVNSVAEASSYLNTLDHRWWHPNRIADHTLIGGCPQLGATIADGAPGNYFPWEGLVFDLGGPSNQVAIFATNDHGPQPCESIEYTVYLSDNPFSQEIENDPTTLGIDPNKWNRAVLKKIFTKGWEDIRTPDPVGYAACGDTALYAVEQDSFVTVFALPCGVTFRYTAIVAGNDGLDFAECAFDSNEGEIDAIAGLTEDGAGVCSDADTDQYVDCACAAAPPVCDCDDTDPAIHPGAPEACDSPDLNCDLLPGACAAGLFCHDSVCIPPCSGTEFPCPGGSTCESTAQGMLCVPIDCSTGGCPVGGVCKGGICVPACDGVVCPGSQVCVDGQCADLCASVVCPPGTGCQGGQCVSSCDCYAGDLGCVALPGTVCDAASHTCVAPNCLGVSCGAGEVCDPTTGLCESFCNTGVVCPFLQKCVAPDGCVPFCTGVVCEAGFGCDPLTDECHDLCDGVVCLSPLVCQAGSCVQGGGAGGGASGGGGPGGGGSTGNGGAGGGSDDGCNCSTPAGGSGTGGGLLACAAMALAFGLRRRR